MPTFIYSPGVRVYIESEKHGILDVSEDLTNGTMVRRVDGVSTFDFGMMNARRKYDGVFTPNDRIVVMMKRVTWLRTFTGLLNSVPLKTAWPQEVTLSSSCSLKRLQYWYWDPASQNTQNMIMGALSHGTVGGGTDHGLLNVLLTVLKKVTGWDARRVHVGKIPDNWYPIVLKIAGEVENLSASSTAAAKDYIRSISPGALWSGDTPASASGVGGSETGSLGDLSMGPTGFLGSTTSTSYAGTRLDATQRRNAELIMSTGWDIMMAQPGARGSESKALATTLAVAMVESGLRNLPSAKYPESSALPHDTYPDGSIPPGDNDSVGLFQQRAGWGSIPQRMDPQQSTAKFLTGGTSAGTPGLLDKAGWKQLSVGALAQSVQVSASPGAYAKYERMGYALVTEMVAHRSKKKGGAASGTTARTTNMSPASYSRSPTGSQANTTPGKTTGESFVGEALNLVERYPNITYTQEYGGTHMEVLSATPPPGLDCSSFVQAVMLRTLGWLGGCPRTASAQAGWSRRMTAAQALNTQGALLFKSRNGTASGVYHVEISLGDGNKSVGAHHAGVPAGVASDGASYWDFGGLAPTLTYGSVGQGGGATSTGQSSTHVGGTGHWPVAATQITTAYHVPGSHWACGYHTGIDFGYAKVGDRVESVDSGYVISAGTTGWGASYGNHVVVQCGDFQVGYCHLSVIDPAMTTGAQVSVGQKIGEVGATGNVTGPHLHLEVRKAPYAYGNDVDPETFITKGAYSSTAASGGSATSTSTTSQDGGVYDYPLISSLPGYDPTDKIDQLFGNQMWAPIPATGDVSIEANELKGVRALMNDQPLLPYIKNLFYSTMRSFCSAPNGDLIGWFPDYYGLWGTAAKLRLEAIEILDFNVSWSDDNFVTHQFAQSGTYNAFDVTSGDVQTAMLNDIGRKSLTLGIANIDSPTIMSALFGIEPENAPNFAAWIYKKFGARPNFFAADGLVGPKAELFAAIHMFMIQWAYQYRADVPLTFMPEAWPGMLVQIPTFDFQAYITTVTHTFTFGDNGGGFSTSLNLAAPAYMPRGAVDSRHALFGLPLAGGYSPGRGIGNPPAGAYGNAVVPPFVDGEPAQPDTGMGAQWPGA